MSDIITVHGLVISSMPIGEYDSRIVLLTRERGKISAIAKGARRLNNPCMVANTPFVFGLFTLYEGRSSYRLNQVSVTHQFVDLASRHPAIYYGYYFLELADYFGREGMDEKDMMNLLYVAAKALIEGNTSERLIRVIFELRLMAMEGMCPVLISCAECGRRSERDDRLWFSQNQHGVLCEDCHKNDIYARPVTYAAISIMNYIVAAPLGQLFHFTIDDQTLNELENIIYPYMQNNTDRKFKSLSVLNMMV